MGPLPAQTDLRQPDELGVWIQTGEMSKFLIDLPSKTVDTTPLPAGTTVRLTMANDAVVDFASAQAASPTNLTTATGEEFTTWHLVMHLTAEAVHTIASSQPRTVDYQIGETTMQIALWGGKGRALQLDFACLANRWED